MKKLLRIMGIMVVFGVMVLSTTSCSLWGAPGAYTKTLDVGPVDATGASTVRIEAGTGTLEIRGVSGLNEIRVLATAWASSQSLLEQMLLSTARDGDVIRVTHISPLNILFGQAGIDLIVEVPDFMAVEVVDGTGVLEIDNVASVSLTDGTGDARVTRVAGDVAVTDGTGLLTIGSVGGNVFVTDGTDDIDIDGIAGNVIINSDGTGDISVMNVGGGVAVYSDGTGDIRVQNILGDFAVNADGTGTITYDGVQGNVRLP